MSQFASLTIEDVTTKTGEGQHGPWKLYQLKTQIGSISTFDAKLGTLAEGLMGATVPMEWDEEIKKRRDGEGTFTARTLVNLGDAAGMDSKQNAAPEKEAPTKTDPISVHDLYALDPKQRLITAHGALKTAIEARPNVNLSDKETRAVVEVEAAWIMQTVLDLSDWTPTPKEEKQQEPEDDGIPFN